MLSRLVSTLSFLLASVGTVLALTLISDSVGAKPGLQRLNTAAQITKRLANVRSKPQRGRSHNVFLLGDSTLGKPDSPVSLAAALRRKMALRFGGSNRLSLQAYSGPGLGPRVFYFMADEVIATNPDLVVWELSFTHFSKHWNRASMEEFSGWLQLTSNLSGLITALEASHVTFDRIFLYQGLVDTGLIEPWRNLKNEQSRVGKLLSQLSVWTEELTGSDAQRQFQNAASAAQRSKSRLPGKHDRLNLDGARTIFGAALQPLEADHSSLSVISKTLERFYENGIPVVVYLNPVNVDNLSATEATEPEILKANAELLREIVEAEGASFFDYHDLLRDEHFGDAAGHFNKQKQNRATNTLAKKLCGAVSNELKRKIELN